jgi:hypothetical protein
MRATGHVCCGEEDPERRGMEAQDEQVVHRPSDPHADGGPSVEGLLAREEAGLPQVVRQKLDLAPDREPEKLPFSERSRNKKAGEIGEASGDGRNLADRTLRERDRVGQDVVRQERA